jgi:hypothetical protein
VADGHCECYDYKRHGDGHLCKHRLALEFSLKPLPSLGSTEPNGPILEGRPATDSI